MSKRPPYPFVKWAGGKSRLVKHITSRLPDHMDCYYEPMVGGGAVLIHLAKYGRFNKAVIADTNYDLITTWNVIKREPEELIKELKKKKYRYDKAAYLRIRAYDSTKLTLVARAARLIYLNKTCFNGLWRVNQKGEFNVPFGKYTDPIILDKANIRAVSELLKNITIYHADFEESVDSIDPREIDGIYIDPPYLPISNTAKFSQYTEGGFTLKDHERLAKFFKKIAKKTRVVLTNSASDKTAELYEGFDVDYFDGRRNIGGPAKYRFEAREAIIFAGKR